MCGEVGVVEIYYVDCVFGGGVVDWVEVEVVELFVWK